MEEIVLVDENDKEIGTCEKLEVHRKGLLHRAFSVFIFNSKGELLLQRRAMLKYHSPGLWTNTCCSHQLKDKSLEECAIDRLNFEMGFKTDLRHEFTFSYRAELDRGLIENEIDHVYFGRHEDEPNVNIEEVMDWKYVDLEDLKNDVKDHPENYTAWFKIIINRVILQFEENFNKD